MRISNLVAAGVGVWLSLSGVAKADPIDISTLVGPTTTTPIPPIGNGTVTDPASTSYGGGTTSRLALYVPGNVYKDYPGWLPLYKALVIQGIPVRVTKDISVATQHSAVLAYQALQSKYMGLLDGMTWSTYVASGKTLIAVGYTSTDMSLGTTFGVTVDATTNKNSRQAIVLAQPTASVPASSVNSQFDFTVTNDYTINLWADTTNKGFDTIGYTLKSGSGATAPVGLAGYSTSSGSTDTRKAITLKATANGGKAIAIGIDVGAYVGLSNGGKTDGIPRSYDAQYDPGYDTFFRLIKSLYSTATTTGLVTNWPVPANKGVHFSWTYDIDAQDSYSLAYDVALDLQSRGIKGTINWQAKLIQDAYDINSFTDYYRNISRVEALGNMELASHSVSHSPNLLTFPVGTGTEFFNGTDFEQSNYWPFIGQCDNSTGTWTTTIPGATTCDTPNDRLYFYTLGGSLMGEVRVSKYILEAISINQSKVRSYRTGHLLYPDALPQVLAANGILYSSSSASNDQNTHMPFQSFFNKAFNQEVPVLEFGLGASDEDGLINGDWAAPGTANYPNGSYAYQQYQVIQKIAKYGGQYTFLTHPTTHALPGVPATLFSDKLAFQKTLNPKIADIAYFDSMGGRGDFHAARIVSGIDVSVAGTTATVTVTLPKPIRDLTLRVPTAWKFKTSTVAVQVNAAVGAVTLVNNVAAGTYTLTFATSGTVASSSAPVAGPTPTTTTISIASPTLPAATPTPTNPLLVEDFSDPSRYYSGVNARGFATGDDNTGNSRSYVQQDWVLFDFKTTSYWYSVLGAANTCTDLTGYTKVGISVRYPSVTTPFGWQLSVQDTLPGGCTGLQNHYVNMLPYVQAATKNAQGWYDLEIPISAFTGFDITSARGVSIGNFSAAGKLEVDYIYFAK
ncbi:hypothetical protein DFQ27_000105 [Actinomortierella ambigua]|uniref:Uncharacterized protein n=1 Tax=Actinomortierella ambigua TaxID=1343610 RepID=A0A9P6UC40_9FUNG|nr:hypothetical protein DFQ27_000105 [Actinomortierella ambigua]